MLNGRTIVNKTNHNALSRARRSKSAKSRSPKSANNRGSNQKRASSKWLCVNPYNIRSQNIKSRKNSCKKDSVVPIQQRGQYKSFNTRQHCYEDCQVDKVTALQAYVNQSRSKSKSKRNRFTNRTNHSILASQRSRNPKTSNSQGYRQRNHRSR